MHNRSEKWHQHSNLSICCQAKTSWRRDYEGTYCGPIKERKTRGVCWLAVKGTDRYLERRTCPGRWWEVEEVDQIVILQNKYWRGFVLVIDAKRAWVVRKKTHTRYLEEMCMPLGKVARSELETHGEGCVRKREVGMQARLEAQTCRGAIVLMTPKLRAQSHHHVATPTTLSLLRKMKRCRLQRSETDSHEKNVTVSFVCYSHNNTRLVNKEWRKHNKANDISTSRRLHSYTVATRTHEKARHMNGFASKSNDSS